MAFLTIVAAPGLSVQQRREAARCGPPAVLSRDDHQTMLRTAGFASVTETDVTAEYRCSVAAWLSESSRRERGLRAVLGAVYDDRQNDRRLQLTALDRGLLRRALFVATIAGPAPGGPRQGYHPRHP